MMLAERIETLRAGVADAARAAGRDAAGICIVAVSKKQAAGVVRDAIDSGITDIGENYVQEARAKFEDLPPVRKHFIGHIQTNKAKAIVAAFDVVQSIDRLEAGLAIARAARTLGKPVQALVQINISPTERFGVAPHEAMQLAESLRAEGLAIDGVMAIGPNTDDATAIGEAFATARDAFGRIGGSTLSIGMSHDWRDAISNGSTMLRIGTAIFGART